MYGGGEAILAKRGEIERIIGENSQNSPDILHLLPTFILPVHVGGRATVGRAGDEEALGVLEADFGGGLGEEDRALGAGIPVF